MSRILVKYLIIWATAILLLNVVLIYYLFSKVPNNTLPNLRVEAEVSSDQLKKHQEAINPRDVPKRKDELTFGHVVPLDEDLYLVDKPQQTPAEHRWRYRSNGLYYTNTSDPLYLDFHTQMTQLRLKDGRGAVLPPEVKQHQEEIVKTLKGAGLEKWAKLFANAYPYTLTETTFPLHDGTTYVITGDIPLQWIRDSCAQFQPYLHMLSKSPVLRVLTEGLLRRQSIFLNLDPYGTSYRLFLDFDFVGKKQLTPWDCKSGRTVHVAMHNYELDNLAYHMRLSHELYSRGARRALDGLWLSTMEKVLEVISREQDHSHSAYVYPELPQQGKGSKVCPGDGLTWSGFRPSDDATQFGYLIPSNMFAVVSLKQMVPILRDLSRDDLADKSEQLAQDIDKGIHKHGVVLHPEHGKIYAYEVDACGNSNMMDDANIPSLLSIPYLQYESDHDPELVIQSNTRRFVLSKSNPHFHSGTDPTDGKRNYGVGSPHTPGNRIWHMSIVMQALATKENTELKELLLMLQRTATNDLMHESFDVNSPARFTRASFAWSNSLLAELIDTRLQDIIRVLKPPVEGTVKAT